MSTYNCRGFTIMKIESAEEKVYDETSEYS